MSLLCCSPVRPLLLGWLCADVQADHLRLTTLQQMHKILTTRQAARGLLALGDYFQRLRTLSSLWAARPREAAIS